MIKTRNTTSVINTWLASKSIDRFRLCI